MKRTILFSLIGIILVICACSLEEVYETEMDKDARRGDMEALANKGMGYREDNRIEAASPESLHALSHNRMPVDYDRIYQEGIQYAAGNGVAKNPTKAFYSFKHAAESGNHAAAQYELARCYKNGTGVKKNLEEAYYWMCVSSANGYLEAERGKEIMDAIVNSQIKQRVATRLGENKQ